MNSLETGIIVSIAAFFFFSFLIFTFLREGNISKEILSKTEKEKSSYQIDATKKYSPEQSFNILNIIVEGENDGGIEE